MDKKIWEEQYPEMPELFHLAVEQAVNRAVGDETAYNGGGNCGEGTLRPEYPWSRILE